jgi:hypothetical protein
MALMSGIELHVVKQYYALVEKYRPNRLLTNRKTVAGQMP